MFIPSRFITASILSASIGLAAIAETVQAQSFPLLYVPMGSEDHIAVINTDEGKVVRKITGVENVHGLARVPATGELLAGSYSEYKDDAVKSPPKPAGVSADDHAARPAFPPTLMIWPIPCWRPSKAAW